MNRILAAIEVLYQGKQLANPTIWKNTQALTGILLALLPALLSLTGLNASDQDVQSIVGGVVTAVGLFNAYATIGTSTKVGLPAKSVADTNIKDPHADVPNAGD